MSIRTVLTFGLGAGGTPSGLVSLGFVSSGGAAALNGGTIVETSHTTTTATLGSVFDASGGTGTITYQWQRKTGAGAYANVSGATSATLYDTGLTPATAYTYKRIAIDSITSDDSNEIAVTTDAMLVGGTIALTSQTSTTAVFASSVAASGGTGSITYQWKSKIGVGAYSNVSGATSATLSDSGLTPSTAYTYKRTASDSLTSVDSNEVAVTTDAVGALVGGTIAEVTHTSTTTQLSSSVAASGGTGAITYQWQRKAGAGSYANVSGATSATLTDSGLTASTLYTYKRIATDALAATAASNEVAITTSAAAVAAVIDTVSSFVTAGAPRNVVSKTSIANMALGHIGVSQTITNIDTERSQQALQCRIYYDQAVQFCLESFPWPFATAYRMLALVAEEPVADWTYAYRYPSDCCYVRRVATSLGRTDRHPPPFHIGQDEQGAIIFTNEEDAQIEYTANITNTARFSAKFIEALSWKLASDIAPALSRIASARKDCLQMAMFMMTSATTTSANEQQQEDESDSEFITVRN
jgi:hypothetical protein